MNILEIKGLSKTYSRNIRALNELDLSVPTGSIFGFLGPNGAGKTTTINTLAGLVKRDKGEIYLFGNMIREGDYHYKQLVGWVLESPIYFEKLTTREYLEFVAAMYRIPKDEAKKRASELVDFLDLTGKERTWIESLSAGMKKKVSLAAAIIHRPRMLILDEPLEGIDPVSARHIKETLRLMVGKGTTVFLSSHALDTVEKLCDEVAIINKGKVVFQSKTVDIRKKIRGGVGQETSASLEDIFIYVVSGDGEDKQRRKLSWL